MERKAVTVDYMREAYAMERWTHVYTDGSAEEATRNGRGGIFIKLNDGGTIHHAILTGKYLTNNKAEQKALRTAASILMDNLETIHTKVVIFSNALHHPSSPIPLKLGPRQPCCQSPRPAAIH